MFRNLTDETRLSGGQSSSSPPGLRLSSAGLVSQESPWLGLFSAVSRPAMSLLHRYLPVRAEGSRWAGGHGEFLRQLEDVMVAPQLSSEALRDMEPNRGTQIGYGSSTRMFLGHVLLSSVSSQEGRPAVQKDWTRTSGPWWGNLWRGEEGSQTGALSRMSWFEDRTGPGAQEDETKGTNMFVLRENSGSSGDKEHLEDNGLHIVQNTEGATTPDHLSPAGAALSPDQDHGYSSLEEEQALVLKASGDQEMEVETSWEPEMTSGSSEEDGRTLSGPQCQNKAIAFIMGCPCSEDESSEDEDEDEDEDDDGFDSEGSSLSTDEEEEVESSDSDSDVDSDSDRVWNSLNQSLDPYNPQSFTAQQHSTIAPPRSIPPSSTPPATPTSSSPPALPPPSPDLWDDSTSASEADEAESLRQWSLLSCSSDPYSPFNFQVQIRTQGLSLDPRTPPHHEAEERLDSGFSEPSGSAPSSVVPSCGSTKKVRFCDVVEEFFAACENEEDEDRRGPWEELARDRCRFLRRCQEVEQNIAYCLQPQHRRHVMLRLQDTRGPLEDS